MKVLPKKHLNADGKIEEETEKNTYLLGMYFFYGDIYIEHSKTLFSILDLLSKFGGLYGSIFQFLGLLGGFYNSRMFIGELVSRMYYLKESSEKGDVSKSLFLKTVSMTKNVKRIEFTTKDVFSQIKLKLCVLLCR